MADPNLIKMPDESKTEMPEEVFQRHINQHINENPDSIEIGTPSKGGAVKVYGDYSDPIAFKKKIDSAKEVKDYAQANLAVSVATWSNLKLTAKKRRQSKPLSEWPTI
jgi:hypothetical protein